MSLTTQSRMIVGSMTELITKEQALQMLRDEIARHGSQMNLAAEIDIDLSYISYVLRGKRPLRHRKILDHLGLEPVMMYRKRDEATSAAGSGG